MKPTSTLVLQLGFTGFLARKKENAACQFIACSLHSHPRPLLYSIGEKHLQINNILHADVMKRTSLAQTDINNNDRDLKQTAKTHSVNSLHLTCGASILLHFLDEITGQQVIKGGSGVRVFSFSGNVLQLCCVDTLSNTNN